MTEEYKALSVEKFCELHDISVSFFYKLKKQGKAPKTLQIGARRIITPDAVKDWQSLMCAD